MKKIISILICLNIFSLASYSLEDEFVDLTLDKNLKIRQYFEKTIVDDFAFENKNKNYEFKKEEVFEYLPKVVEIKDINKKLVDYDYLNSQNIKVKIVKNISTKHNIQEGEFVEFQLVQDTKIEDKFFKAGMILKARVETISPNKIMGVPSEIIIGNFSIDNISFKGQIDKTGANRSIWVSPSIYIGSMFFGAGLLLIPIRGGHAKIKTKEIYVLQYIPEL